MYIKGADLRRMRLSAKRTTSDMARVAGVKTRKTYENWEHNVGLPSVNQFAALCDACGISPSDFMASAQRRGDNSNERLDIHSME
ncbi:XRE family transcriptional regulator [Alteromonadaceae bacterium M269]|nr:XRE family transcriptional regulator [Alteromonadaceae bacterium M269]